MKSTHDGQQPELTTLLGFHLNPVTDIRPLRFLTGLTTLHLSDTPLTDLGPLYQLTNLERLEIRRVRVPPEQLQKSRAALPHCKIFISLNSRLYLFTKILPKIA